MSVARSCGLNSVNVPACHNTRTCGKSMLFSLPGNYMILLYPLHHLCYPMMCSTWSMLLRLHCLCYVHSTMTWWSSIIWAEWAIFLSLAKEWLRWPISFLCQYRRHESHSRIFTLASTIQTLHGAHSKAEEISVCLLRTDMLVQTCNSLYTMHM